MKPHFRSHATLAVLSLLTAVCASPSSQAEETTSQYHCEQNLLAESGFFANDMSLFFIDVKAAPTGSESPYQCTFGQTGTVWMAAGESKTVSCALTVTGSTVLVKDVGTELRLAIDEAAFIWRGFPKPGSDRAQPADANANAPCSAFATVRETQSGSAVPSMRGYRLDCTAI